jgi:hypothetical protein
MDKHSVPGLSARYEKLNQKQDLLLRLNQVIPWETFRPQLNQIHEKVRKSAAGRKPTDEMVPYWGSCWTPIMRRIRFGVIALTVRPRLKRCWR